MRHGFLLKEYKVHHAKHFRKLKNFFASKSLQDKDLQLSRAGFEPPTTALKGRCSTD